MRMISNGLLAGVRDQVRMNALQSFEFYANTVLSLCLKDDTCQCLQDACEERRDVFVETQRGRAVAIALFGWLSSRGATVVSSVRLPHHEVALWVDQKSDEHLGDNVVIEPEAHGVRIQWV